MAETKKVVTNKKGTTKSKNISGKRYDRLSNRAFNQLDKGKKVKLLETEGKYSPSAGTFGSAPGKTAVGEIKKLGKGVGKRKVKFTKEDDVYDSKGYRKSKPKKQDGASAKFPEIKEKNEGKFTKWVEKNMGGMDTCKAASKIMRSRTKKYSPAVVKMANYANNFGCKTKKEDGASVPLKGNQKNLPEALRKKILASDGASLSSKRADKKIAKGQMHKKMSAAQKQEAMKNKTARFTPTDENNQPT